MSFLSDLIGGKLKPVSSKALQKGTDFRVSNADMEVDSSSDEDDYEDDDDTELYVKKEIDSYFNESRVTGAIMDISEIDQNEVDSEIMEFVSVPKAFRLYKFNIYRKKELPIDSYREQIMNMIISNSVSIIDGPTGCGKTTQVPQFILDYCKDNNLPCNIVVTQPRRIAAINISQRVSEERGWGLGTVCGYQVGLDKVISDDVVLTYVTTEILLQRLIFQRNLNKFTHIIIDEVHERTKALDFLLLMVRKYLFSNSPGVKIVLMSATMESDEFAHYFRSFVRGTRQFVAAPIIHVTKKGCFSNSIFYIDHLSNLIPISDDFNYDNPTISSNLYKACTLLLSVFDKVDEIDARTNERIIGSVLVFLPGYHQIEELHRQLEKETDANWEIVPMHSSLPSDQLSKAFEKPKKGNRKIILATNIAESSITVPDVYYVIDFCLTKTVKMNPDTKFSTLTLDWASHNNCIQRAGRVGRVNNGRVYRLVPSEFYKTQMKDNTVPEMQRAPLESVILYMKMLDLNDTPKNVLSLAMSPPNLNDIESCIWHLKEMGALLQSCRGRISTQDGDLTFLGRVMGSLPIDVHLSKLIMLGHMFNCLHEAVVMATGCMVQNLFTKPYGQRLEVFKKKMLMADGSRSDLIILLNLYNVYQMYKRQNKFRNFTEEYNWCRMNCVNFKGLKEWNLLISEIYARLKRFQIETSVESGRVILSDIEKPIILKVIICGAFYPNYFARIKELDMRDAVKTLNGRDPFKTVYLKDMKSNQPARIYIRQIKELLNAGANCQIGIDHDNDSKIFIEYKSLAKPETITVDGQEQITTIINNVPFEVYESVKRRHYDLYLPLKIMPDKEAWKFFEFYNKQKLICESESTPDVPKCLFSPLPSIHINYLSIKISSITDPGHFYYHDNNPETTNLLCEITKILNRTASQLRPALNILVNHVYAARFEDHQFYRCKVLSVFSDYNNQSFAQIIFIDYGNCERISTQEIYDLPEFNVLKIPSTAVCCALCEIQPSPMYNPKSVWSQTVIEYFSEKVSNRLLNAKIYSVVDEVVHLELYPNGGRGKSINNMLLDMNFAVKCEEGYQSKMDHQRRLQAQTSLTVHPEQIVSKSFTDYESPNPNDCTIDVNLKGPYSPLEANIYGLMRTTLASKVKVETDSINSVFLDDDPESPHMRLIVAAHVKQSLQGGISIGQTTVMPSIEGFPAIMSLLFSPTADFKVNKEGTKIGSILCGLGAREGSNKPCYSEHDLCLNLDIVLNSEIILRIDELRYCMNQSIKVMAGIYDEIGFTEELINYQKQLKNTLFQLLRVQKKAMDLETVKYADSWNKTECDNLEILKIKNPVDDDDIWPMLIFVRLNEIPDSVLEIKKNLDELSSIAKNLTPATNIKCMLCGELLVTMGGVRRHILSEKHLDIVEKFKKL